MIDPNRKGKLRGPRFGSGTFFLCFSLSPDPTDFLIPLPVDCHPCGFLD